MRISKFALLFVFIPSVLLAAAPAQIGIRPAIPFEEILQWSKDAGKVVECRELTDVKNTTMCLTSNADQLRNMMGRASYYVEAEPRHTLLPAKDPKFLDSDQANYIGHDVMAEDLKAFFADLSKGCSLSKKLCPTDLEAALYREVIEPSIKRYPDNFVVIAAESGSDGFMGTVSHEILHARFFINKDYQDVVTKFWQEKVTADDREKIEVFLADTYNFDGDKGRLLLINEFQAYTLEDGSLDGEFSRIAKAYGHDLQQALGPLLPLRPDQVLPAPKN